MNDFSKLFTAFVGWVADIFMVANKIYIIPKGTVIMGYYYAFGLTVLQFITALMLFTLIMWFFSSFFKLESGVSENGGDSKNIKITYKGYKKFRTYDKKGK